MTKNVSADWPLVLIVPGLEPKRGAKFHGTDRQLTAHLRVLNRAGVGGSWGVDAKQLPEHPLAI